MEDVQADAQVVRLALGDQGHRRVQAGAEAGGPGKLQGQPDPMRTCQGRRLRQGGDRLAQLTLARLAGEVGHDHERRGPQLGQDLQATPEVVPVGLPFLAGSSGASPPCAEAPAALEPVAVEQGLDLGQGVRLQVLLQLRQPEFDRRPARPRVRLHVRLERLVSVVT